MYSVFSADEIGESFWPEQLSATPMNNHCQSEWSYDRLLQDVPSAVISPTSSANCNRIGPSMSSNSKRADGDKNEISEQRLDPTFLKTQLDRACAAVARSRDLPNKPGESSSLPESQLQATKPLKLGSQADGSGHVVSSTVQCASDGGPTSVPELSSVQKNSVVQVKQTTSESSREDSEDEELEGDTGTTENLDPAEVKRVRRMQSNRESARRSRRRKQEHMNELETQVGQLKVEHTSLLKRLTDINQKYDNASVDNRILKADIETLRTKVKMAEETVKRVTGINPLLLAMSNLQGPSMPFMGNTMDSFASSAMPVQQQQQPDTNHQFFHHSAPHMTGMNSRTDSTFPGVGNLQQNGGGTNSVPSIPEWGGSGHKQ